MRFAKALLRDDRKLYPVIEKYENLPKQNGSIFVNDFDLDDLDSDYTPSLLEDPPPELAGDSSDPPASILEEPAVNPEAEHSAPEVPDDPDQLADLETHELTHAEINEKLRVIHRNLSHPNLIKPC